MAAVVYAAMTSVPAAPATAPPPSGPSRRHQLVVGGLGLCALVVILFGWSWALARWHLSAADAALSAGKLTEARAQAQAALRYQPRDPATMFLLGRVQRRLGVIDEAVQWLDRAQAAGMSSKAVRQQRTLLTAQSGRIGSVDAVITGFVRDRPDDVLSEEVYEALTKGLMFTGRVNEAEQCLHFWLEWRPDAIQPRIWLAELNERRERWKAALTEYEQVLAIDAGREDARRARARCLLQFGATDQALKVFRELLGSHPGDIELRVGIAKSLEKLGHSDEALAEYEVLWQDQLPAEELVQVSMGIGRLQTLLGRPAEAAEALERLLTFKPNLAEAHLLLATVHETLGRSAEAQIHRQRAQELQMLSNQFAETMEKLAADPRDGELRYEAGRLLEAQGYRDEAVAWWNASLALTPDNIEIHRKLAEYYREQGRPDVVQSHEDALRRLAQSPADSDSPPDP